MLTHHLALTLSTEDLTKRIGHKKVSAGEIAMQTYSCFKEKGLDYRFDGNLLGHCLLFKTKLFNDSKLEVPWRLEPNEQAGCIPRPVEKYKLSKLSRGYKAEILDDYQFVGRSEGSFKSRWMHCVASLEVDILSGSTPHDYNDNISGKKRRKPHSDSSPLSPFVTASAFHMVSCSAATSTL